ncbi:centrosome and spindle pole-associated protein 1 [Centroberyx gerrardi]
MTPNPDKGDDFGLSLLLGAEYEKKKQKLQQELRLDYKHYVSKKKDLKAGEPRPQPQSLSLPIGERRSAKEKLRDERNKEYNLFLKEQPRIRWLKRETPPITSQVQASDASSPPPPLPILNTQPNVHPTPRECPSSRRDAGTVTEADWAGTRTGTRGQGPRGRRRWHLQRPKEPLELWERRARRLKGHGAEYSSEEELNTDEEEELEFSRRRRDRHRREPEDTEREERGTQKLTADRALQGRAPQDTREVEAPGVHDQNNSDWIRKSHLQMPDSMRTAERSRSAANKDKAEFATGLMIGAVEGNAASQMRKERYRQELLEQMAEQQRNRTKEKELELRVAATGAIDPEKKPDRIKQFGAVNRQYEGWRRDVPYKPGIGVDALGNDPNPRPRDDKPTLGTEERGRPGKPQVTFPSPTLDHSTALSQLAGHTGPGLGMGAAPGVPSLSLFNEDYHRNLSNTLGEMAAPRRAGIPPPMPPALTDTYKTPYDPAYYYYGARNPLDPNLPYYQNGPSGGGQQSGILFNLPQGAAPPRPNDRTGATDQHGASPLAVGVLPGERPKQTGETGPSYQEALRQQIKESEERKRREKEEKERYDAKIEAEMVAYNPWGRSGGGAPIKDKGGNLISDLNQMHRTNEEAYMNPESRDRREAQGFIARNGPPPGAEDRASYPHRVSGFTDRPSPQQLHQQDSYKDFLKLQMEEKRRKQVEERERVRMEEEREEKRLAEQRARMQQEYEKEQQKKQEEIEHRLENQRLNRQRAEHRREEERRVREEQESQKKVLENGREREQRQAQVSNELQREPSPPVPTLQKKPGSRRASRPSTVVSLLSSRTASERSVSAPHSPPVPARRNQLRAKEDQQKVISELSALRRYLQKERRQLEGQLGQTDREETDTPPPARRRGRPKADAFDLAQQRAARASTSRAQSGAARINMQNIREFNQLKYRDSASREEVLHVYPDPPGDAQSLDIQQQALLREQQRTIRNMKRGEEHNSLNQQLSHHRPKNKPALNSQGDSVLMSDSAFIDFYSGDASREPAHNPQVSAEDKRRRTAPRRREDHDELGVPAGQREHGVQPDSQSLESGSGLHVEAKVRAQNQPRTRRPDHFNGDHNCRSEGLSGDEVDVWSLRSTPCALERRVSVETVATEPWLRPGTSDAVRRPGCKERPSSGMDAPPWLTHNLIQLP